ncbi:N-acetyltransferase [Paenibacillus sp. H1-7]|uniref:GNAT family N-acetyltransferase n=1 Tax=Paenibacillus sp. H1-7 TaxID=2282849 RepID=UPI001EF94398|nr:N-acetyltransferase [Paenibacillus sp. H1-7]ULL19637.1 N-acetyltransferase [Paenibacillus sp. H1-7]
MTIRMEEVNDYRVTEQVIQEAFAGLAFSDQKEHELVRKLRHSEAFIPELSLVFEEDGRIAGHILLSKIMIVNDQQSFEALALAPVSVLPSYQKQGIGAQLVRESLQRAKNLGYPAVIVMGHEHYYPKFGFQPASRWGITAPFEVPDELFMALELEDNSLKGIHGVVQYASAFYE